MTTPEQKPMWWNRSPQAHYRRQPMRPNHVQRIRSRSDRAWAPSLSTPIIGPLGAGHTMKAIFGISFIAIIAIRLALAADSTSPDLREYVCTNRFFAVPESFQTTNVEECWRLVKANPNRFEPHLVLATALTQIGDRKSTRLNSSHSQISYAVFCLKKKTNSESAARPPALRGCAPRHPRGVAPGRRRLTDGTRRHRSLAGSRRPTRARSRRRRSSSS